MINVLLIGDYNASIIAHNAIPKALTLAAPESEQVEITRLATTDVEEEKLKRADAIWCVPGSPYASMEGALTAIRFARENNVPFLGTCGGFQHALIEYARNILHIADADHTESNPETKTPLIAKLTCALINKSETIRIYPNTRLSTIYGSWKATEPYQCSYGFNPAFKKHFEDGPMNFSGPLHFTAFNDAGEVRAFELTNHPFFIATLFQPERSASSGQSHPLIAAFLARSHHR